MTFDKRTDVLELRETLQGQEIITTDLALATVWQKELGQNYPTHLLPDATVPKTASLVNVSVAPLRAEPRQGAEMLSQTLLGQPITLIEKANPDWYRARCWDGYIGYIHREHVFYKEDEPQAYDLLPTALIGVPYAQATLLPDPYSEPVFDVSVGCRVALGEVAAHDGQMYRAVFGPDRRRGYLPTSSLLIQKPDPFTPAQMVAWAASWMGTPYLWGGVSPRGFDCSGLVQLAAFMSGISLPRDASQQVLMGQEVARLTYETLQTGDLLFFGDEPGRITHEAIYDGQGRYIHASGWVRRNSLRPEDPDFEPYRRKTWQLTRRLAQK
jgi:hypothetical protein